MAADYTLWLSNPTGQRIAVIGDWLSLEYTGATNAVAALNLTVPLPAVPWSWLVRDARIEVMRAIDSGLQYLDMDRSWLLRYRQKQIGQQGQRTATITALSPVYLLSGPIIAYNAGSAQASKSGPIDNMMKALVRENLGSLAADSSRNLGSVLSVEADTSQAPSISKEFSRRSLLTVLQELAQASAQLGTRLYFDVVWTGTRYEFQTYVGQRGIDHRYPSGINPLQIGPDFGNLADANMTLADDWRDEVTFVYAGGQGQETERVIATASDAARIAQSPFGRREQFIDDTRYATTATAGLTAEAQAALWAGRPRTTFRGQLLETPSTRYGLHWRWGDALTATIDGEVFDCRADVVKVAVQGGEEQIECWLEGTRQ